LSTSWRCKNWYALCDFIAARRFANFESPDGSIALVGGEDSSLLESAFSVDEGALTPIFAAAHPSIWTEKQRYGGAYLMPFGAVEDVSENGKNMKLAEDLWKVSEEAIKV
jgi:hypothetical protein